MRCNVNCILFLQKNENVLKDFGKSKLRDSLQNWPGHRDMTISAMGNPSLEPEYFKSFFKLDTWGSLIIGSIVHDSIVLILSFLNVIIIMWL